MNGLYYNYSGNSVNNFTNNQFPESMLLQNIGIESTSANCVVSNYNTRLTCSMNSNSSKNIKVVNARPKKLKLLSGNLFNARSVKNKLPDLYQFIYNNTSTKLFLITESWLNSTISDSMVDPLNRFTVYRRDRPGRTGGA